MTDRTPLPEWKLGRKLYRAVTTGPLTFKVLTFRVTQLRKSWMASRLRDDGSRDVCVLTRDAPDWWDKKMCRDKFPAHQKLIETRYAASERAALRELLKEQEVSVSDMERWMAEDVVEGADDEVIEEWKAEIRQAKTLCTKLRKAIAESVR